MYKVFTTSESTDGRSSVLSRLAANGGRAANKSCSGPTSTHPLSTHTPTCTYCSCCRTLHSGAEAPLPSKAAPRRRQQGVHCLFALAAVVLTPPSDGVEAREELGRIIRRWRPGIIPPSRRSRSWRVVTRNPGPVILPVLESADPVSDQR